MDRILEFLQQEIDVLFGLTVWMIGCIGLGIILVLIVIIAVAVKSKKKKKAKKAASQTSKILPMEEPVIAYEPFNTVSENISESEEIVLGGEVTYMQPPKPKTKPAPKKEEKPDQASKNEEKVMAINIAAAAKDAAAAAPAEKKEEKAEPAAVKTSSAAKTSAVKTSSAAASKKKEQPQDESKKEDGVLKGKYVITKSRDGQCTYTLQASNGVTLFESDTYSSIAGCKNAINTFKSYVSKNTFEVAKTESGEWVYLLKRPNGVYTGKAKDSEAAAKSAVASVQKFYDTDSVVIIEKK